MAVEKIGAYEIHPLCAAVPDISAERWPKFRDSIGKNGLRKPIMQHNGQVIGGRQRLRACLETNTSPRFVQFQYKGKTPAEIEAEIKLFIQIEDLDRRQLPKSEIAIALAKLFPSLPRGRPARNTGKLDPRNSPNGAINRPPDGELADAAGTSKRELQRARTMLKGCIPAIIALVDAHKFALHDAANVADMEDEQQRACLKEARAQKCSLNAARTHLYSKRDGLSDKTEKAGVHWLILQVPIFGETSHLAIDSGEEKNHLQKPDGEIVKARCLRYGKNPGEEQAFERCRRCELPMFKTDPDWDRRNVYGDGVTHRECPDGRGSR